MRALSTSIMVLVSGQPAVAADLPLYAYIPILLFFVAGAVVPLALLGAAQLLSRGVYGAAKMQPYECGVDPVGEAKERFSVKYYLVAMLFLVFDVETVFLIPWAVIYDRLAIFGLVEMLVFIGILVVGYYFAWRKGALEWA